MKIFVSGKPVLCVGRVLSTKTMMVMKLIAFLLLAASLHVSATGYSQTITLNVKNTSLEHVFQEIRQQSGYEFIYDSRILPKTRPVTMRVKDASLQEVLDFCFSNQPFTYEIVFKTIVVKNQAPPHEIPARETAAFTVRGKLTNQLGDPVPDVSVSLKNSSIGTITNASGNYSLALPDGNGTLIFSSIGYTTAEETVRNRAEINVVLQDSISLLDNVVVVGYGTQKKRDVTGAISSIPKERLQQLPNTNIAEALQGSIPGLQINTNAGGAEGSSISMLVRGRGSISASNSPLIIWDGIPFVGGISEINTNDIESIDILKDASAAAIYGSRGSNGVILITSKQGKKGKLNISYDGYYGTQTLTNKPDLLNGEEFYKFKTTRLNTGTALSQQEQEVYESGNWVDWYDLATRTGSKSQHTLSVAGGSEKIRFYFGGTLLNVQGVSLNDQFKRYSLHPSLTINVTPWLTIGSSTQLSLQDRSGLAAEFDDSRNTGGGANFFNPLTKPYNPDGSLALYAYEDYTQSRNPLANTLVKNDAFSYRVFTANHAKVQLPFIKGLSYQLNSGVEYENSGYKTYYGRNVARGYEVNGDAINYNSNHLNMTLENIVNYTRSFGDHDINLTMLYSSQDISFDSEELEGVGFPNDVLTNFQMNNATQLTHTPSNYRQNLISQMGRLNYGFKGKYLLTLTGRRDGYSGFGAGKKYGFFPTAAVGWNISQERFMQQLAFVNNLKLRVSYGLNGNQAVSSYGSLATLAGAPYISGSTILPGYIPSKLANEELSWESKTTLSIGLDFSLFNNRVQGSIDYYNAHTKDLLLQRNISSVQGFTSVLQNIGKTANEGIELGLTTTNIESGAFTWTSGAVFSYNKNWIIDLYGDGKDDAGNKWFIGKPIRVIYGLQYDGIFRSEEEVAKSAQPTAKPGWVRIKDVDGDNTINTGSDRTLQGNLDPSFVFGLTNTFRYKGFSLMIFLNGVADVVKGNPLESDDVFSDTRRNTIKKDWWSPENPNGTHFANDANANQLKVAFVEDASFLRLRDVSLAYELPKSLLGRLKITALKVYGTARNLATLTGYNGLDPELTNQYGLPLQRELIFGLTIGL